jgi:thiol peroxidase
MREFFFIFNPKKLIMANVTLKGNPVQTNGDLPKVGSKAIDFDLRANDLSHKSLSDFAGKRVILNIFPSVDTGTCAASVRRFNETAAELDNTAILCVSKDLPFAQARFCGAEGLDKVVSLSDFESGQFGKDYGLQITDGPLKGLITRAIVVLDESQNVVYTELVDEITEEPNYKKALDILS